VYIMGYGRSGSTLLDVMLGSHRRIVGAGEVAYLPDWLKYDRLCSCGSSVRQCAFWTNVLIEIHAGPGDRPDWSRRAIERSVEARHSLPRLLAGRIPLETQAFYGLSQKSLFAAISRVANRPIIVDSSKSVHRTDGRCLALQRLAQLDVRVVHLIRDGRAVTWSGTKIAGHRPEDIGGRRWLPPWLRALWVAMDWTITNLIGIGMVTWLKPGSVIRVRYEDLVRNPRDTLATIGSHIGVDLTDVWEMIEEGRPFHAAHNIGGNRLRFAKAIRLQEDMEWRERMPLHHRVLYAVVAWPAAIVLGYRLRDKKPR